MVTKNLEYFEIVDVIQNKNH